MNVVEESILIRAPHEALFDLSQDYGLRLEWDPFLRDLRFLDGAATAAAGVKVWVRAWNRLEMTVEFVAFNRPHAVAMRMVRGPLLFRTFAGSWRFQPGEGDAVEVIFRYTFQTRWPWLRWLVDPMVRWALRRDVRARLRGLRRGAEEQGLLDRLS